MYQHTLNGRRADSTVPQEDFALAMHDSQAPGLKVLRRKSSRAIILGIAVLAVSIAIGKSFIFFGGFLIFSLLITLAWRKFPAPWVLLVSVSAATPVLIGKYQVSCNLAFAFWALFFSSRYLFKLPRWIYALLVLVLLGLVTSSINWMSEGAVRGMLRQATHAYNFILAPIFLLPFVYVRMKGSTDNAANLKGLLYCLIVPSTVILFSAKTFGTVINAWEASRHAQMGAEGFYIYSLGKAYINFSRTDVGFILAALICASAAVTVSKVKLSLKVVAGACLASNIYLLLITASFGSMSATLCGLAVIFAVLLRTANVGRLMASMGAIVCMVFLTYALLPDKTLKYLEKRYEHRVEKKDTDRLELWAIGAQYFLSHPEGIGHALGVEVGGQDFFVHNEYITQFISYGLLGGLAYLSLIAWMLFSFVSMRKTAGADSSALAVYLAGLGVLVAASVNSMTDHLSGNRVNYNVIWSLIWYCYFCSCAVKSGVAAARDMMHSRNSESCPGLSAGHDATCKI